MNEEDFSLFGALEKANELEKQGLTSSLSSLKDAGVDVKEYSNILKKTLPTNSLQSQQAQMLQTATKAASSTQGEGGALGGAAQGALAGLATGNPQMAVVGGVLGGLSGALQSGQKAKEEKIDAQIQHQQNLVSIEGAKNALRQNIMNHLAANLSATLNRR